MELKYFKILCMVLHTSRLYKLKSHVRISRVISQKIEREYIISRLLERKEKEWQKQLAQKKGGQRRKNWNRKTSGVQK